MNRAYPVVTDRCVQGEFISLYARLTRRVFAVTLCLGLQE